MKYHRFVKLSIIVLFSFLAGRYSYYWQEIKTESKDETQLKKIIKQDEKQNNVQVLNIKNINYLTQVGKLPTRKVINIKPENPLSLIQAYLGENNRVIIPLVALDNDNETQITHQKNVLYSSLDIQERLAAIDMLTDILASEAVAVGLGDKESIVRIKAIEGLQQIASDNAIRYIGQSLYSTNTLETKLAAINALSELSYHPGANQFLRFSSQHDDNQSIRIAALKALREYSVED